MLADGLSIDSERWAPGERRVWRVCAQVAEEAAMVCRALYLLLLFVPAAAMAPLCIQLGWRRQEWLLLLRWTLQRAGAVQRRPTAVPAAAAHWTAGKGECCLQARTPSYASTCCGWRPAITPVCRRMKRDAVS